MRTSSSTSTFAFVPLASGAIIPELAFQHTTPHTTSTMSSPTAAASAAPTKLRAADKFELRAATSSDAAALGALASRTFTETFGHLYLPEHLSAYLAEAYNEDAMRKDIEHADKYTVLLFPKQETEDDQLQQRIPCGYGMLADKSVRTGEDPALVEHSLEVKRVYVDSAFHGCGAAYLLMDHLMAVVREKGARRHVWLGVWEHNVKAQKFYHKYGFREVGEHTFLVGETKDRDLLYELQQ